jgi:hypothetical protein
MVPASATRITSSEVLMIAGCSLGPMGLRRLARHGCHMTSQDSIRTVPPRAARARAPERRPRAFSSMPKREARAEAAATPVVHVAPVGRTAKWRVHDGDPSEPASEHASTTDAEAAAYSRATQRGAHRIVIHDRYHRTRLIDPEPMPDQPSADSTARDQPIDKAGAGEESSLRPTIDQMGEWSFPASDPPATWTWDPPAAPQQL